MYSVINRRLIDALKKYRRDKSRIVFENNQIVNEDVEYSFLDLYGEEDDKKDFLLIEVIKKFNEEIKNNVIKYNFSAWEKECLETIIFLYDNEAEIVISNIMSCMGVDTDSKAEKSQFNNNYMRFKAKMKKYLKGTLS